jgi:hypothetical protein
MGASEVKKGVTSITTASVSGFSVSMSMAESTGSKLEFRTAW